MIIIPSGRPKIWDKSPELGAVPANKAYTGTFHQLCKEYAQLFDSDYLILSPKFGFLYPDSLVPHTYDVRFTQKGVTKETISLNQLQAQWQALDTSPSTEIIILGGKKFQPLMEKIATDSIYTFNYPLHGLGGIGYMQRALKNAIEKGVPLS
jgi:hypothetical protein